MEKYSTYKDLDAWKQSRILVREVYQSLEKFPRYESNALADQLRRAVVSVASNIAEGCGRETYKEGIRFFMYSRGSLFEVETQITLASDLCYITEEEYQKLTERIERCKKLLNGLIRYFRTESLKQTPRITNNEQQLETRITQPTNTLCR